MNYKESLEYIISIRDRGMLWGLERIRKAWMLCGAEQGTHPRYMHVAGTNGKGSVSCMLQNILTAAGHRTGLFTSPAIGEITSTISVDGEPIPDESFAGLVTLITTIEADAGVLTEFEMLTLIALLYFSKSGVEFAVIECGLGGLDDATNVIPPPAAAIFTPIALDHIGILGDNIADIAGKKCGIIKPTCAVVSSPAQHPDALDVIFKTAAENEATVYIPAAGPAPTILSEAGGITFSRQDEIYHIPMTGRFQCDNALTAIQAAELVVPLTPGIIRRGLSRPVMPCRQEIVRRDPLIMLDGAHNLHGVAALADTLRELNAGGITLITGMLADKPYRQCMKLLLPFCSEVICCTPPNNRALSGDALADVINELSPGIPVTVAATPTQAAAMINPAVPLLVAGSFYVSGEIRRLYGC